MIMFYLKIKKNWLLEMVCFGHDVPKNCEKNFNKSMGEKNLAEDQENGIEENERREKNQ